MMQTMRSAANARRTEFSTSISKLFADAESTEKQHVHADLASAGPCLVCSINLALLFHAMQGAAAHCIDSCEQKGGGTETLDDGEPRCILLELSWSNTMHCALLLALAVDGLVWGICSIQGTPCTGS